MNNNELMESYRLASEMRRRRAELRLLKPKRTVNGEHLNMNDHFPFRGSHDSRLNAG